MPYVQLLSSVSKICMYSGLRLLDTESSKFIPLGKAHLQHLIIAHASFEGLGVRLPFPHLLDSTSISGEIMSEHCDQVDEARWMMGCRDCFTEYIPSPGPFPSQFGFFVV